MLPLLLHLGAALLLAVAAHVPPLGPSSFSPPLGPHIAELNVLLPPRMTNPVEYRLLGTGGCFSWSWDHHDILSVQPEYNGSSRCSTSARLISIAPYSGRKETAVYAADLQSGTVIRCEVFIDKISRIRIFHHSVKLDLHGLATLRVRAFDEEENIFSSLVGLQFMWQFVPKSVDVNRVVHHLVHVPLKDTPLSDCGGFCGDLNTQIKLEQSGVGSDLYVVKGTEIGHERVLVHLLEQEQEHLADEIVLTVAEAISLDPPSPIFVLVGAMVQYSIRVIHQNTPQVIVLPSAYHRWSVSNSTVAKVDSVMGLAHALKLGSTNIIVEDIRLVGHLQFSTMYVVLPRELQLYIVPVTISYDVVEGSKPATSKGIWYITSGQIYIIYMKIYSQGPDSQEIYITEKDDVNVQFNDSAHWNAFLLPANISKHAWRVSRLIKATSPGLGSLSASLTYQHGDKEKMETLKILQQILVCDQVKISMGEENGQYQTIHLPWAHGIFQEIELTATGGCAKTSNDYIWFSSDLKTVSVSGSGSVKAHRPGQAIIKVATIFDSMNYDKVVVEVSIPSSMIVLQTFPVEAVVGTYLPAAVTLKTSHGNPFYRCDSFDSFISWQVLVGGECFKIVNKTEEELEWAFRMSSQFLEFSSHYGSPCGWVSLYASHPGRAMLQATLSRDLQSHDHSMEGPIHLKASLHIAAYLPLIVWQAGDGNKFGGYWVDLSRSDTKFQGASLENLDELHLVPATGVDVLLVGGPERWVQEVEFIETVEMLSEDHKALKGGVDELVAKHFHGETLYRISCPILGRFKLVFSRGNLVGEDHPLPAISNVELSLICAVPSFLTLIANEPVNRLDIILSAAQADRGQGRIRTSPVTVANGCTIRISAVGIHSSGRAFANSSSLSLSWELSCCEKLAYWKVGDIMESSESSWERFLVLQNATGVCIVRATVVGFSAHLLGTSDAYLLQGNSEDVITDAIRLQVVSSLRVIPEYILLFFSPDAKANISVTGGTCHIDAAINDTQVVEVIQLPPSTQCAQLILGVKGLGISLVTVQDMGLSPTSVASAMVRVADVDWIKIKSEEAIKLMVGKSKSIDILAGNYDGGTFDSSQYAYMTIHVHLDDDVLELVDKDGISSSGREINSSGFMIRATCLGVTTIYVSIRQRSGREILSEFVEVEVYAPPRIHPDYVFLAPGASFVLVVKGGPQIGVIVEYSSFDDATVAIQNSSGRVSAISAGKTTIRAAFYGHAGTIICEANGRIEVGIPSAMMLNVQSEQLGVGCEMPIFPWFTEGNLFSFYELCNNYQWTIEDEQVLTFQKARSQFHHSSHELASAGTMEKDLSFINVVYGRSAGRTVVAVSFSCNFIYSGDVSRSVFYNASASLSVIAPPPLALGVPITWVFPPFYISSEVLPTSTDSAEWDSHGRKRSIIYSLLRTCDGKNEFLQQDAIAIDGSRIKTKESNNIGCIIAKDRLTGNMEVASCVRVAEVAQVRASTKEFPCRVADIAVGSKLELFINFRDALGNPFYEAYGVVELEVETNYPDILSIRTSEQNATESKSRKVYLEAMHHGRALVRISIGKNPVKADYILISVGAHLHPQNPILNIHQHVNFSVIGEGTIALPSGRWASSNRSVIFVNELSGEAHAVGEGSALVLFESSNLKLQTTVNVRRAGLIFVEAPAETLTNIPSHAKGYNFLVQFRNSYEDFGAAVNDSGALYDCKVDPSFIGYAKPWRDLDSGYSYCLFFPHTPEHLVRLVPKLKAVRSKSSGSEGLLYVSITASLRGAPEVMGSAHALFVGGFSILEMGKMNLTPNCNRSIITIVGNTDVEIHWKARERILVSPLRRDDSGIGGCIEYEVQISDGEQLADKIIFILPATGQTAEIDVSYVNGQGATSTWTSSVVLAGVLGCAIVLVVTVLFFIRLLDRPERTGQAESNAPSAATIVTTPNRSPSSNTLVSPRTPQPYVDYVKRTIDETPYYRRGRRRFDPQRTY